MAAANDDDPGFWPGYVAAIAGLVQGLLIMTMALGISIFALGQLASVSKRGKVALAAPEPAPALAPGAVPTTLPDYVPPQSPLAPPQVGGFAPEQPPPSAQPGRPTTLTFEGDAVAIPGTSEADIVAAIERDKAAGSVSWQVRLAANLDNPRDRRAGYLRLLAMRNILVNAGVAPARVDVRLIDGPAPKEGEGTVAEFIPVDGSGRPMRISSIAG